MGDFCHTCFYQREDCTCEGYCKSYLNEIGFVEEFGYNSKFLNEEYDRFHEERLKRISVG